MSKKPPSLADEIKAAMAAKKPKPNNWFDRLPAEDQAELIAIKGMWLTGEISGSGVAVAAEIVERCRARGIKTCGPDGVRAWLSKA